MRKGRKRRRKLNGWINVIASEPDGLSLVGVSNGGLFFHRVYRLI